MGVRDPPLNPPPLRRRCAAPRSWSALSSLKRSPEMRTSLRILACLALALALAPPARVRANDVGAWTPEFAFKVKRVSQVRPSPDGRHVAYVVGTAAMEGEKSEWISQIWVADADGRK